MYEERKHWRVRCGVHLLVEVSDHMCGAAGAVGDAGHRRTDTGLGAVLSVHKCAQLTLVCCSYESVRCRYHVRCTIAKSAIHRTSRCLLGELFSGVFECAGCAGVRLLSVRRNLTL